MIRSASTALALAGAIALGGTIGGALLASPDVAAAAKTSQLASAATSPAASAQGAHTAASVMLRIIRADAAALRNRVLDHQKAQRAKRRAARLPPKSG